MWTSTGLSHAFTQQQQPVRQYGMFYADCFSWRKKCMDDRFYVAVNSVNDRYQRVCGNKPRGCACAIIRHQRQSSALTMNASSPSFSRCNSDLSPHSPLPPSLTHALWFSARALFYSTTWQPRWMTAAISTQCMDGVILRNRCMLSPSVMRRSRILTLFLQRFSYRSIIFITIYTTAVTTSTNTNKLCGRPPKYAPPVQVDLWPFFTLKVVSESRVTCATSVPILVSLGFSVLDLGLMYATEKCQTDVRQHHRLMPPPRGRDIIIWKQQ